MTAPIRRRLLAIAALLAALVAGGYYLASTTASADDATSTATADTTAEERAGALKSKPSPTGDANGLVLGSGDSAKPETMEQLLTAVTQDVDAYWTKVFADSDLPEPRVSYAWIPAGQTAASACGDADGALGDTAAAYCSADDTIYISQKFATDIYNGALDRALPGSSQGYGRTLGDMAVAYIVAHEYGHQVQDELGLFQRYGQQIPTMAFELQADCYAGTWAKSAQQESRLEDGDVQEAIDAAAAVGDFNVSDPGHHGTPEQRTEAWTTGFESGDPSVCSSYLGAAT